MNKKTKTFPLPLSSVMGRSSFDKPDYFDNRGRFDRVPMDGRTEKRKTSVPESKPVRFQGAGLTGPVASKTLRSMTERLARAGIADTVVLNAIGQVPRHLFVEPGLSGQAYEDVALPIGAHQTISKPSTVARMLEALRAGSKQPCMKKILEIGTGCGYQAAVLAKMANEVYSVERIKSLHELARRNLRSLRIANLRLHYGDGMLGLPQVAPFDGIIVSAAGVRVPDALLDQLAIGGRLVAPIGLERQTLQRVERVSENKWESTVLDDCHFVPLQRGTV
ncbi:protein-L-isoaspartate(D-aspartate) O-methyltransferase [Oxalobacter aliiformigenes]|uniref:protein-L-isoaspartate(D-aspartate) O-methyltransferase n=1 Tax=Oxalobacter aliiformigenes TaxID=2946593 RepID=UPI0022AE7BF3|nr:protein-L-isoaspartate(D-aspartate) O-methyltransferase [Oxalobacter aliiformigenes]MCZ4065102.1 protein-L-isoaspartate(D-aspartate) O-methyltransferase [Oxalobacter aliiformigenes]WAV99361.1 protein-L-isoaspartate(D-aspartate) O-methyltransferase [Oxalobacter aliiformigenes]